jgi:hypothetical protein
MKSHFSGRTASKNAAVAPIDASPLPEPQPKLVLLRRYCQLTGDTARAVHDRRRKGQWIDGKHCFLAPGRRVWVNLAEINAWIMNPACRT